MLSERRKLGSVVPNIQAGVKKGFTRTHMHVLQAKLKDEFKDIYKNGNGGAG